MIRIDAALGAILLFNIHVAECRVHEAAKTDDAERATWMGAEGDFSAIFNKNGTVGALNRNFLIFICGHSFPLLR